MCKRSFTTPQALADHAKDPGNLHTRFPCKSCNRLFKTKGALNNHTQALHPSSSVKAVVINTAQELDEHKKSPYKSRHIKVLHSSSSTQVTTTPAVNLAYQVPTRVTTTPAVNRACQVCHKSFKTARSLRDHKKATHATTLKPVVAAKFVCGVCKQSFKLAQGLADHTSAKHKRPSPTTVRSLQPQPTSPTTVRSPQPQPTSPTAVCSIKQQPTSPTTVCSIKQQPTSPTTVCSIKQQPIAQRPRDMKCTFCEDLFKSPSGIAQHIESGVHKFHRHHVTASIQAMGIVPQITIKHITEPPVAPTILSYVATAAAFNGTMYECFICKGTFRTLAALNSHLNSAAHDDNEFKCPKCNAEFTLISGLVQHLESHCCGLAPLIQIDDYFNKLEDQFSRMIVSRQIEI
ncbi:hypothetical protein CVT25_007140 [Psilocybe cyanescens]|uniref:C2H2-type domain-containing protein n=1 Tax=Psilocybe cyanescens TaxID=93625 RepID=A0A409WVP2_PSICY|nr:hypothetical protein CVT25_007140 [Psilocybe cyanescens]